MHSLLWPSTKNLKVGLQNSIICAEERLLYFAYRPSFQEEETEDMGKHRVLLLFSNFNSYNLRSILHYKS